MKKILFFIVSLFLLFGCSNINNIESPHKAFSILKDGNVYLEGKWTQIGSTSSYRIIPKHNAVSILCDKKSGICTENQALLVTKKDNPTTPYSLLYPEEFTYVITEWSDKTIKAERKPPVADVEIRISLTDKSAEKSWRETKARGSDTANPNIVGNWILKYMNKKQLILVAKILKWCSILWAWLVSLSIVIGIIGIFIGAGSLWRGWIKFTDIFSPLNAANYIVILVFLIPAIAGISLSEYLRKKAENK